MDEINKAIEYVASKHPANVHIVSNSFDRFHHRIIVFYTGDWPIEEMNSLWQEVIDRFGFSLYFQKK